MATGKAAFGTLLYRETSAGSGTFTAIGGVVDPSPPAVQAETADVTQMSSAGGFRQTVATLSSLGEMSFTLVFDSSDSTQSESAGMLADAVARTERLYKIVCVDGGALDFRFNAVITNFAIGAPLDGAHTAAVTLKPTGQPTLA